MEVPSANIGNFENVFAICHRGVEIQKVIYLNSYGCLSHSSAETRIFFSGNIVDTSPTFFQDILSLDNVQLAL